MLTNSCRSNVMVFSEYHDHIHLVFFFFDWFDSSRKGRESKVDARTPSKGEDSAIEIEDTKINEDMHENCREGDGNEIKYSSFNPFSLPVYYRNLATRN